MEPDLSLSTQALAERAVVSVGGEVDVATAKSLTDHALAALRDVSPHIVVDLGDVTFMDSTGLKSLITISQRASLAGGSFAVVGPTSSVRKLLRLTGLEEAFPVYDTLAEVTGRAAPTP
jgi:anti-anti-sigma factor